MLRGAGRAPLSARYESGIDRRRLCWAAGRAPPRRSSVAGGPQPTTTSVGERQDVEDAGQLEDALNASGTAHQRQRFECAHERARARISSRMPAESMNVRPDKSKTTNGPAVPSTRTSSRSRSPAFGEIKLAAQADGVNLALALRTHRQLTDSQQVSGSQTATLLWSFIDHRAERKRCARYRLRVRWSATRAMSSVGILAPISSRSTRLQTSSGSSAQTARRNRSRPASMTSPRRSMSPSV